MKLSATLGKTIRDFCRNGFTGSEENHCAHYVCHVLGVDSGYTCKIHNSGSHAGACLRVQELFADCPAVGNWSNAQQAMCIVFVTDRDNVSLQSHSMRNVPKKHVGIFSNGFVYHYANTQDIVIRQTPSEFLARFQATYGGNQALFFGSFPAGASIPDSESAAAAPAAAPIAIPVPVAPSFPQPEIIKEVSGGKTDYSATLPGVAKYYVARGTKYESYRGLYQPVGKHYGPRYDIPTNQPQYETVAGLLGVIGTGESECYFNRINSYDRAAFTFGFFQLAAHKPGDNLILLFRRLAAENAAFQALFPDLKVVDGVLHRLLGDHSLSLEKEYPRPGHPNEMNLKDFMAYLNPDGAKVDDTELSVTARLVHLANTDSGANNIQVNLAAQITMRKLRNAYATWYNLDGVSDLICTAIADIHHQGRGTKTQVRSALSAGATTAKKVEALCKIGEANYAGRCATLKRALAQAKEAGHLGTSVFDKASGLFKPISGWPE